MDKPYYETEEYSEAENELDSYDDPIKLVMEYRISEKHKDSQIAELKKQLEDYKDICHKHYIDCPDNLDRVLLGMEQQLHDLPEKIVGEIKEQLFNHFKVKNIEEYEKLPLIDSLFTADTVIEILDAILKKYGGENDNG